MNQINSQILGILLGLSTAIGCILYEKIVHNFSYLAFLLIWCAEGLFLFVVGSFVFENNIPQDWQKFSSNPKYWLWALLYVATGITSLLWYKITKHQGVMVSSLYEIKYVVMLAMLYILFGDQRFTGNTAVGLILAILSIYFISKN